MVEAASATLASDPASRDAAGTLATETLILSALERVTCSGAGGACGGASGGGRGGAGGEEDAAGVSAEEEGVATELPLLLLARNREDMQVGGANGNVTQGVDGCGSGRPWGGAIKLTLLLLTHNLEDMQGGGGTGSVPGA